MKDTKINVYGLGYIGLPTASLLATKGYNVLGIDTNQKIIDTINNGDIHIVEPDLDILVKSAVNSKMLLADNKADVANIHIIAVPTPFTDNYEPDLSHVKDVVHMISQVLRSGDLVILESTSPVGTTKFIYDLLCKKRNDLENIYVVHSPERVIPGHVLRELVENDRIIGGINDKSTEIGIEFYKTFVNGEVLSTNAQTAEMCKLTENAFRDVNIAFANELSLICQELNIDVWNLIKFANKHPRVNILNPGPGVGGHCIAVDPWFIVHASPDKANLIKQARIVNEGKKGWVVDQVISKANKFKTPTIACLGATYKADIDDLRESPALEIIKMLQEKNIGPVLTVEPNNNLVEGLNLVELNDALNESDVVVVLVDHKEFKGINKNKLLDKIVIDTKGIFS